MWTVAVQILFYGDVIFTELPITQQHFVNFMKIRQAV
jgi:hypothetical protein